MSVVSAAVALSWFHPESLSTAAFVSPRQPIAYGFNNQRTFLSSQHGSDQVNEPSNEWGIPYSSTLPALAPSPAAKSLPNGGRATLLGSGPGDPELLTVAAYKLLSNPPEGALVVADRLVSKQILDMIPCEIKVARKLPGCAELAQEEIYWWCYQVCHEWKKRVHGSSF